MNRKHLIVIGGPTASGKSQVAITLAQHFHCDIVSADSRQVFSELNMGVNKPTLDQLNAARHHLVGHVSIHQKYNAGSYEKDALQCLDQIFIDQDLAILVGGTGLYIKAVLNGLDLFPEPDPSIVEQLKSTLQTEGLQALQLALQQKDPVYFEQVDTKNPHRLIRALAIIQTSGQRYSDLLTKQNKTRTFLPIPIFITEERKILYDKINARVDWMVEQGLKEEAQALFPLRHLNSLQTVGYQEWFDHFEGKYDASKSIEKIKQHTRNYAKRQWTWFKPLQWPEFTAQEVEKMKNYIQTSLL